MAGAAEFIVLEDECNGRQLMIQGAIEPGDAVRFAGHLARMTTGDLPIVQNTETLWTLKLDSPGGDLTDAMAIGRLVRQAYVTTEVSYRFARRIDGVYDFAKTSSTACIDGDDRLAGCAPAIAVADCTGACLLIWLAGIDRRAIEGRLGRHGLAAGDVDVAAYLREMEVDSGWIEHLGTAGTDGSKDDGWLTWSDRDVLGGRTRSLDVLLGICPAPLTEAQVVDSVMTEVPERRAALLDQAEAYWDCRNALVARARTPVINNLAQLASSAN